MFRTRKVGYQVSTTTRMMGQNIAKRLGRIKLSVASDVCTEVAAANALLARYVSCIDVTSRWIDHSPSQGMVRDFQPPTDNAGVLLSAGINELSSKLFRA